MLKCEMVFKVCVCTRGSLWFSLGLTGSWVLLLFMHREVGSWAPLCRLRWELERKKILKFPSEHSIPEWFNLEGILKIIKFQPPYHEQRPSTRKFSRVEICEFKFGDCCISSGNKIWEISGASHRSLEKKVSLCQHRKFCLGQGLGDSVLLSD